MNSHQKVLFVDAGTAYYRIGRYSLDDFYGPVDLGLHLAGKFNSTNIGVGLLAGSIFPGSNRLIFSGFSPCWGGFYLSTMGGAGLVFDNLGINMIALVGKAPVPSVLFLNRAHGEEIDVRLEPVKLHKVWSEGRGGVYGLLDHVFLEYGSHFETEPRILAVGPAAEATDFGSVLSVPVRGGKLTSVDTWAGRGGFGSRMLQQHGIAAIIFGGTYADEDFRDRKVADEWFRQKYDRNLGAKDLEATVKYRYDPRLETGGTLGVNFATMGGRVLAFNYRSIYMREEERVELHRKFILEHYLRQFNEETIAPRKQQTCGEPCPAVCKKLRGDYKKDYEPYQTMGPLCGIFDQRAAERLNRHADRYGFDAISVGGVLAWLMDCLVEGTLRPEDVGFSEKPVFDFDGFRIETDSLHNAEIGCRLLDGIVQRDGMLDFSEGPRKAARRLARRLGKKVLDPFLYVGYGRKGWMVPNQYWTPGVLTPMPIVGKYFMYYGNDFMPPRELGRMNAERLRKELILDNLGMCRFHRGWAEEMMPDILDKLLGKKSQFLEKISVTASRINSRNASIFWEPERAKDFLYAFLLRKREVEGDSRPELASWIDKFARDKDEAALEFWYETHKGIHESLREF